MLHFSWAVFSLTLAVIVENLWVFQNSLGMNSTKSRKTCCARCWGNIISLDNANIAISAFLQPKSMQTRIKTLRERFFPTVYPFFHFRHYVWGRGHSFLSFWDLGRFSEREKMNVNHDGAKQSNSGVVRVANSYGSLCPSNSRRVLNGA